VVVVNQKITHFRITKKRLNDEIKSLERAFRENDPASMLRKSAVSFFADEIVSPCFVFVFLFFLVSVRVLILLDLSLAICSLIKKQASVSPNNSKTSSTPGKRQWIALWPKGQKARFVSLFILSFPKKTLDSAPHKIK